MPKKSTSRKKTKKTPSKRKIAKPKATKIDKVLAKAIKEIRPSAKDRKKIEKLADLVLKETAKEAKKYKAKPMLVGSLIRDTWLSNKFEFDVFVLFPIGVTRKQLEKNGLKIGKAVARNLKAKSKVEYAEHPYVCCETKGVHIDIVPCYELKSAEGLKCAVDRTPFHVKYLEKNLSKKKSDEVRLLKQFCKANGIYGADAKTEGFSGYVCELLILKYGSLGRLLSAVREWNAGYIIDLGNFYDKKDFQKLRRKFKGQPLILIDPVDKNRNAAAAVSSQNFYALIKAMRDFVTRPSKGAFFRENIKPVQEPELMIRQLQRRTELIIVKFTPPRVVPDILWPQLRRFAERLESILSEYEFVVLRKDVYTNEKDLAVVLLEMEVSKLPIVQKRTGPQVFDADDSKRFTDKYKSIALNGPFIENNFWAVEVRRQFLTAREKLMDSLKDPLKILKAKGIPSHIAKQISKDFQIILETDGMMKLVKKDEEFGIFLRKYFQKESLV